MVLLITWQYQLHVGMTDFDENDWFLIPSINFSIYFKYFCTTLDKAFIFESLQMNCFHSSLMYVMYSSLMYSSVGFKKGCPFKSCNYEHFRGKRFTFLMPDQIALNPCTHVKEYVRKIQPCLFPDSAKSKRLALLQILVESSIWSLITILQNGKHDYKQQLLHFVHRKTFSI